MAMELRRAGSQLNMLGTVNRALNGTMADINEWEHLQTTLMRVQNRIVRDSFRDDLDTENLAVPESALRHACIIKDNDTAAMVSLRLKLFYDIREAGSHGMPNIYSVPDFYPHESNKGKAQVILLFSELTEEWKQRKVARRKQVRVSYRIVDKDCESITEHDLTQLAARLNTTFPRSWFFKTGKLKATYIDKARGWNFITAPYTKKDGKTLIEKVMGLEHQQPDWDILTVGEHTEKNYKIKQTARVLGKIQGIEEKRQIARVFLDKAEINLYGAKANIMLIDRAISHRVYGNHQRLYG